MYYKLSDFIEDWKYESESTIKVLNNLTDEALTVKFNNEIRTAGRLAWHIAGPISELGHRMGLTFEKVDQDSPFLSTAKEIVDEYKSASDGLIKEIKEKPCQRHARYSCGFPAKLWTYSAIVEASPRTAAST